VWEILIAVLVLGGVVWLVSWLWANVLIAALVGGAIVLVLVGLLAVLVVLSEKGYLDD
jgi:hypothetical protein